MFSDLLESLNSMEEGERAAALLLGLDLCAAEIENLSSKISEGVSEHNIGRLIEKRHHITEFANQLTFRLYGVSKADVESIRNEMEGWGIQYAP